MRIIDRPVTKASLDIHQCGGSNCYPDAASSDFGVDSYHGDDALSFFGLFNLPTGGTPTSTPGTAPSTSSTPTPSSNTTLEGNVLPTGSTPFALPTTNGFTKGAKYIVISAAASAALIGASTAAMKPYVDLGKRTVGHAAQCPSFNFQSWGDPHVKTEISGGDAEQTDQMNDINAFSSVLNTADGVVTTSTETVEIPDKHAINRQITITSKNYTLSVSADLAGNISAMITNAQGTSVIDASTPFRYLAPGKSPTGVAADGTPTGAMAYVDPATGALDVSIPLSSGGYFNSSIYKNDLNGLDISQSGYGATAVGGMAVAQASKQDKDIVVMPCQDIESGRPKPGIRSIPSQGNNGNTSSSFNAGAAF